MSDMTVLFAAFGAAWVLAVGYIWILTRRTGQLERDLRNLQERAARD